MKVSKNLLDLRQRRFGRPADDTSDVRLPRPLAAPESKPRQRGKVARFSWLSKIFYLLVSAFGWLLSKIFWLFYSLFKVAKNALLSPIRFLDWLLDSLLIASRAVVKFTAGWLLRLPRTVAKIVHNYDMKPPYVWLQHLAIFSAVAFMVTLPVKLFTPVTKILSAEQQVLGASTRVVKLLGLAQNLKDYVPVAKLAQALFGFAAPRRYLVVFQNNSELRGSGGFMGSYALLDLDQGQITNLEIPGGGFYDLKINLTRLLEPPRPFRVFAPYWQIWNANWFADFPASASKLIWFYDVSGGPTVDGVIALTPNLIEDLLKVTGPIAMTDYNTIVTAENFVQATQQEVELDYDRAENRPKAFIADLAPLLIEALNTAVANGQLQALMAAVDKALLEKHLLIYSTSGGEQELLHDLDWSGEVKHLNGDYLMVVHNNTGGGKTDRVIDDFILDEVAIGADGSLTHKLSLTRRHGGEPDDIFTGHDNLDYVRFFVPLGSEFKTASGFSDEPEARFKENIDNLLITLDPDLASDWLIDDESGMHIFTESGKTVFGNWLNLSPGGTKTITLEYKLPINFFEMSSYSLYWQKQAGTDGAQFEVRIENNSEREFIKTASPSNMAIDAQGRIRYTNDLRVDRYFSIDLAPRK